MPDRIADDHLFRFDRKTARREKEEAPLETAIANLPRKSGPAWTALALIAASMVALSACAGGPDRRPLRPGDDRPAAAGDMGPLVKPVGVLLGSMDANGDHLVDGAELGAGIDREWQWLSKSGPVRPVDFDAWARSALGSAGALPAFASSDRNLNGVISNVEFEQRLRQEFAELDKNGDGLLQRSELTFFVAEPTDRRSRPDRGSRPR